MKQIVLIASSLGLLTWAVEAASLLLPSQVLPSGSVFSVLSTVLIFAVPVLAVVVGALGAVSAAQAGSVVRTVTLIILGILGMLVPLCGFGLFVVFAFGPDVRNIEPLVNGLLLFPLLVFLVVLVSSLLPSQQSTKQEKQM